MIEDISKPLGLQAPAQSDRMSDHLVRVGHLKAIQKSNRWSDSELARQCGRSPQQVNSWFSGDRQIGERLARSLEERLHLNRYALDERYGGAHLGNGDHSDAGSGPRPIGVTKRVRGAPVIAWADIDKMLNAENATLKHKAPHLETFAVSSTKAKFLQMPDDSMTTEIMQGDHLLFDPTEAPRAGDIVLIKAVGGEHFVRLFRPRTAYMFEAAPLNLAYQPLSSIDDAATVVGVMVEHRRYRRQFR